MNRTLQVAVASALLLAAGNSWALGLGQLQVKSKRNQPLVAEIPIISTTPGELAALQARLASPETFRRIGLSPPTGAAADLQFSLGSDGKGRPVIRVTTVKAVDQGALNFLIEVDWGTGRLVREYSALVDTPTTASAVVQPVVQLPQAPAANVVQRPQPEPPAPPVTPPVAPPVVPAPAAPTPMPAPSEPAPSEPAPSEAAPSEAAPAAAAPEPLPAHVANALPLPSVVPATAPAANASRPTPAQYGPIKRGETLSKIVDTVGLRGGFSLDQSMLALLRANPDAFLGDDVNRLRSGAVLRVPGRDDVAKIDADEAAQVVRQQMQQWQQARRAVRQPVQLAGNTPTSPPAPKQDVQAKPKPEAAKREIAKPETAKREVAKREVSKPNTQTPPAQAKPQKRDEARLQIVPPNGPGKAIGIKSGTDAGGKGSMLQQELRQRDEDIAAKSAEIGELKDRVAALEKLKDEQQKLISMKDTELATAQSRLAQANQAAAQAKVQPAVAAASTTAVTSQPTPVAEAPKHKAMPYIWGGVGFAALALLAWLLAGKRKPAAPPVRRSMFDSEALAASMVTPAVQDAAPHADDLAHAFDAGAKMGAGRGDLQASDIAVDEAQAEGHVTNTHTIDLADVPPSPPRMETPAWHSGWVKAAPPAEVAQAAAAAPTPTHETQAPADTSAAAAPVMADAVPAHASIEQRFKLVDAFLDMGAKHSAQQVLAELLHDDDDEASAKAARMLSRLVG